MPGKGIQRVFHRTGRPPHADRWRERRSQCQSRETSDERIWHQPRTPSDDLDALSGQVWKSCGMLTHPSAKKPRKDGVAIIGASGPEKGTLARIEAKRLSVEPNEESLHRDNGGTAS